MPQAGTRVQHAGYVRVCTMLYAEKMADRKENIILLILMVVGVVIVPVLMIWTADNLFALTIKTFLAAFFLVLLVRALPGQKKESDFGRPHGRAEDR